jgi:hypothetical protein
MQLNSISQQNQLSQLLNLLQGNSSASGNDAASQFSNMLEEMLKNASANDSINAVNSNTSVSGQSSNAGGIEKLSLTPENLVRTIQMNMSLNAIGSVSDENSLDDTEDDGLSMIPSQGTDMSQLLQIMLGNQDITNLSDTQDTSLPNQSNTDHIIKNAK